MAGIVTVVQNGRVKAQAKPLMTYSEYLAFEATSEVKHEFLRGEVWAMAGGTPSHAALQANVILALGTRLKGRPCRVFTSDLRVRISETDRSTYPDVTVVCGKQQTAPEDPNAITNPTLIVEVLSESTEASDRGEKFQHYARLPSLQEYVLVSQKARRVDVFRRAEGESWTFVPFTTGNVDLKALEVAISPDELYADPTA